MKLKFCVSLDSIVSWYTKLITLQYIKKFNFRKLVKKHVKQP